MNVADKLQGCLFSHENEKHVCESMYEKDI